MYGLNAISICRGISTYLKDGECQRVAELVFIHNEGMPTPTLHVDTGEGV